MPGRGDVAQLGSASDSWSVDACQSGVRAPSIKAPVVFLSKKLYPHRLKLIGLSVIYILSKKVLVSLSN